MCSHFSASYNLETIYPNSELGYIILDSTHMGESKLLSQYNTHVKEIRETTLIWVLLRNEDNNVKARSESNLKARLCKLSTKNFEWETRKWI